MKIGIPVQTPVLRYKSGSQGGYTLHGHVFDGALVVDPFEHVTFPQPFLCKN